MLSVGRARGPREQQLERAIEWLRRAAQLESDNHWYQFFLAYLEDRAGAKDQALEPLHRRLGATAAVAVGSIQPRPDLSVEGPWDFALADMETALELLSGRPEAARVHLEMGYLYHELGRLSSALAASITALIEIDPAGPFGPAARLNLANMDAESGEVERARQEYDALLALKTSTTLPPA